MILCNMYVAVSISFVCPTQATLNNFSFTRVLCSSFSSQICSRSECCKIKASCVGVSATAGRHPGTASVALMATSQIRQAPSKRKIRPRRRRKRGSRRRRRNKSLEPGMVHLMSPCPLSLLLSEIASCSHQSPWYEDSPNSVP